MRNINERTSISSKFSLLIAIFTSMILTACGSQPTPAPTPPAIEPPAVSDPKISAPTPQEPGQEVGISVDVSSASGASLTYEWRVDGGEIIRGDGSPAITYRTPEEPGIYNVRVAVMWDDSSVEKITTIRVEAPAAISADEPPTDTPTPEPTDAPPTATAPPPTSTLEPTATLVPATATPAPTNTPRPTPIPTATIDADPTVYDNFNNPTFDGSFNQNLWKFWENPPNQIAQQNGVLVATQVNKPEGATNLAARKYDFTNLNTPIFFEAKLFLEPDSKGNVHLKLHSDLPSGEARFSECNIDQSWAGCFFTAWPSQPEYGYNQEVSWVTTGEWHTLRMEIDPSSMTYSYFSDGQEIGSYTPNDAADLKNSRFTFVVGVFGEDATGYIDDVRIGQLGQ